MCMSGGCGGSGKSSSSKSSNSYVPKIKQASRSSAKLPKGWAGTTGSNNFGTPKVKISFSGRK